MTLIPISSSQILIDTLAKYGIVQTVSKPTRVTDHSATLIDHVYTNNIENTLSSNVLTLDISDHLATLTTIKLRAISQKHTTHSNRTDTTKYRQTRTINEANNAIFKELLEGETWEEARQSCCANEQYDKFSEIYLHCIPR